MLLKLQGLQQRLKAQTKTRIGIVLLVLFPILTVINTELNQMQSFSKLWEFISQYTGIFIFDIVYISIFFAAILLLVRNTFVATLLVSLPLYILSSIEFLKYAASNTHFVISDLLLTFNVKDIAGLATFTITPMLLLCLVMFVALTCLLWFFSMNFGMKKRVSSIISICVLAMNVAIITSPSLAGSVFQMAGIKDENINSSFVINEEFAKNNFIASLVKNSGNEVQNNILQPVNYSEETINSYPIEDISFVSGSLEQKPNVLMIMSESYSDFRRLKELDINQNIVLDDSIYKNFDLLSQEGFLGETVVPTFGGYTTRTEFELTFGLPVNSMNNLTVPHFKLKNRPQLSIPKDYQNNGYRTYYIHPFSGSFYDRKKTFESYGFDRMIFEEDMREPTDGEDLYRRYMDDGVLFDRLLSTLKNEKAPVYIHTTTMQNHQPYTDEYGTDQLAYYLEGIAHSDEALKAFTDKLRLLDEPTILMFVGDHYPFFVGEDSIYEKMNISSKNCDALYVQPYLMWSNYDVSYESMPKEAVSAFYLPHMLGCMAGLDENKLRKLMMNKLHQKPIYTQAYHNDKRDEQLDNITYDITLGEQYLKDK